jgi:hypothetical protein
MLPQKPDTPTFVDLDTMTQGEFLDRAVRDLDMSTSFTSGRGEHHGKRYVRFRIERHAILHGKHVGSAQSRPVQYQADCPLPPASVWTTRKGRDLKMLALFTDYEEKAATPHGALTTRAYEAVDVIEMENSTRIKLWHVFYDAVVSAQTGARFNNRLYGRTVEMAVHEAFDVEYWSELPEKVMAYIMADLDADPVTESAEIVHPCVQCGAETYGLTYCYCGVKVFRDRPGEDSPRAKSLRLVDTLVVGYGYLPELEDNARIMVAFEIASFTGDEVAIATKALRDQVGRLKGAIQAVLDEIDEPLPPAMMNGDIAQYYRARLQRIASAVEAVLTDK